MKVRLDKESETDLATFKAEEIKVVQKKKVTAAPKRDTAETAEAIPEDLE